MQDFDKRVNDVEKEVSLIQRDLAVQNKIFEKLEETVEKIQGLTDSMSRLITIHDEKINDQIKLSEKLEENEKQIADIITRLDTREALEKERKSNEDEFKKIKSEGHHLFISRLKWVIVVVVFIVGILNAKYNIVSSIVRFLVSI